MNDKITLIIAAAGSGSRMGADKNKILLDLEGKLVIERTLDKFSQIDDIIQLIIVAKEDELSEFEQIVKHCNFLDVRIIAGGITRQESIAAGLSNIKDESTYVIVHDAARPFVKEEHINGCVSMAKLNGACGVGVRVKDTLKKVDEDGMIVETIDRSLVWQMQTPQIFEVNLIKDAYTYANKTGFAGTDDCSLVENFGKKISMFEGDYDNIKLTTKEDMNYAKFMLRLKCDRGELL